MINIFKKICMVFTFLFLLFPAEVTGGNIVVLRYAHMNPVSSVAGKQAQLLADIVNKKSGGTLRIEIYPASQLGSIREMRDMVQGGKVAIHHTTMAMLGELYDGFTVFDTPYLFRDLNHMLRVVSDKSQLLKEFNAALVSDKNLRVFYTFYFGTRELTCNKPVYSPGDLSGVPVRAIPNSYYQATVEGLGARAVPMDFAETYHALATGKVIGQENPLDTIYSAKLYEVQKYLVLTHHIIGMEVVVFNEKIWQELSPEHQKILTDAAWEVSAKATQMTIISENDLLTKLADKGMIVIDGKDGLKRKEFSDKTRTLINKRFGGRYKKYYKMIGETP